MLCSTHKIFALLPSEAVVQERGLLVVIHGGGRLKLAGLGKVRQSGIQLAHLDEAQPPCQQRRGKGTPIVFKFVPRSPQSLLDDLIRWPHDCRESICAASGPNSTGVYGEPITNHIADGGTPCVPARKVRALPAVKADGGDVVVVGVDVLPHCLREKRRAMIGCRTWVTED